MASVEHYRRSPFLALHWEGEDLIVSDARLRRRQRADLDLLFLLAAMGSWKTPVELAAAGYPVSRKELTRLVHLGLAEATTDPSEADDHRGGWDIFSLMVHRAGEFPDSRTGPWPPQSASPPAFKPAAQANARGLPAPPPLNDVLEDVLENRRSIRTYATAPLAMSDVSSLLHHAARVVEVNRDRVMGETVKRPFPTGGARSELEIYLVANDVEALAAGIHYYDSRRHELVAVREADEHQAQLNLWMHAATEGQLSRDPPAVLLVTAVFARTMWKYPSGWLQLVYKDTGCLLQTLYLVATALRLAPCAIANAPPLTLETWLGLNPLIEAPVACFLVGAAASQDASN